MSIKSDCKQVFQLEGLDFLLLGQVAKTGEIFKKNIKLASLSDRQTSRRIDFLIQRDFLRVVESKIYRNMDDKLIKKIGLTFKGCIASLAVESIQNNYLIKKYLNSINDIIIRQKIFSYIKKDIELFFIINRSIGIIMNNINDILGWFEEYDNLKSVSKRDVEKIENNNEEKNNIVREIDQSLKNMNYSIRNALTLDYDRWYEILDMISKQFSMKDISKELVGKLTKEEKLFYNPVERAKRVAAFEKQTMESPQLRKYFESVKKMEGKDFHEKYQRDLKKQRKKLGLG